jgi:ferredoxin--NADP+ reductase
MSAFYQERVIDVQHWTDTLFSFTATRDPGFRFQSGQFTMMGLELDGGPLLRAYSMASANHEESLEFFSIKVPDGPLTSRLQRIRPGDSVLVAVKRPARWSLTICCRGNGYCCYRREPGSRRSPAS